MIEMMATMRCKNYLNQSEQEMEKIKYAVRRAKLSIVAVERQLDMGVNPESNISELLKLVRSMETSSAMASVAEKAARFYGDAV
jgi:hypothetical protein